MLQYMFTPGIFLPDGVGFSLYGLGHILWLLALAVMCAAMIVYYKGADDKGRRRFAKLVAILLLASEVGLDAWLVAVGAWSWDKLPLFPCSFTMFLIAIWSWKPSWSVGQILYGFGLPGAISALLFCNWTRQPLYQIQSVTSFLFHGLLIGWILMTIIAGDITPELRGLKPCVVFTLVTALATGVVNWLIPECNFFFTKAGSPGSPLAVFVRIFGVPWWLIAYAALAAAVMFLEFYPWELAKKRRRAR